MAHLLQDPKGISVLKAYWVNHAVDQNAELDTAKSNKRQACVSVYGVDIHPDGSRFATCGADEKIKIWSMAPIIDVNVEVSECVDKLLCCCKYDKSVNQNTNYCFNNTIHCVKWSHSGRYLGSGAADGIVTLWALSTTNHPLPMVTNGHDSNIENWINVQQLTKHRDLANSSNLADVQEIAFSPNDRYLVSGGSDHNIVIYHQTTHPQLIYECIQVISTAHNDIILGLCFDPLGQFLTSQSADGTAKIWSVSSHKHAEYQLRHQIHNEFKKRSHFIRRNTNDDLTRLDVGQRGSWSPDGSHLLCSFGVTKDNIFISPMYKRLNFENEHSFVGHSKPTTVSKWNPRIYQSQSSSSSESDAFFVAAIGSMDRKLSVWCTNSKTPLIVFSDIGKEAILDVAWSRTGDVLMACTHDGNVMAFVFGTEAFNGRKLTVNQHMRYIESVCGGHPTPTEFQTMRDNIDLPQHSTFNTIRTVAQEEGDDSKSSEVYIPSKDVFAPREEGTPPDNINLNINFVDAQITFDAVEGKQKRHINDYYEKSNDYAMDVDTNTNTNTHSYCNMVSPSSSRKESSDTGGIHELSVRRPSSKKKDKKPVKPTKPQSNKKQNRKKKDKFKRKDSNNNNNGDKKRKREDSNGGTRRKKRKYNYDVFLKMEHAKSIQVTGVRFTNEKESGYLVMESNVITRMIHVDSEEKGDSEEEETVTEVCAFKHVNGSRRMEWKTEIAGVVTQMVCNERWTVCGTVDGELYCFNHYGSMAMVPIQMEEEICFLYMSRAADPHHTGSPSNSNSNHNGHRQYYNMNGANNNYNDAVYLLIITADCNVRSWKLSNDMKGFDPQPMVKSNFASLIRMSNKQLRRKDITLTNGFITNQGTIMLTLTNEYVFTWKVSLDIWVRVCDDKYWGSNQRRVSNGDKESNYNGIQKGAFAFNEFLSAMNHTFKAVSHADKVRYSEVCRMHTISHLEQQLNALRLFKEKENEFERIMTQYTQELIASLSLNGLRFVVNKMDQIFNELLGHSNSNWPGSRLFQRKLLRSLIQIVNEKNTDSQQQYYVQLQQVTKKYTYALHHVTQNGGNHSF